MIVHLFFPPDRCTFQAERALKMVRVLEPHRLWDMEVYSTLLWHLQKTVDLSFLAQELLNINPRSPQAWIAIGNLFSLQKEKTQALACFRRAAQLDPSCAYAYTLSGHESIDEDLDKAITFFQSALRADPRHYNAWYVSAVAHQNVNDLIRQVWTGDMLSTRKPSPPGGIPLSESTRYPSQKCCFDGMCRDGK